KAHVNRGKHCDHLCTLAVIVCIQQVRKKAWEKHRKAEVKNSLKMCSQSSRAVSHQEAPNIGRMCILFCWQTDTY
ncbi:unnamed protein product, partial [Gulo gulo]